MAVVLLGITCHLCARDHYTMYPLQIQFFQNALTRQDQLRQRVAFALHKLIPVSGNDLNGQPAWVAPYLQVLDRNAFGNFRQILLEETLNAGMGEYLNMRGNSKVSPNENYAREVMQLFSVGVDLLNQDGTPGARRARESYSYLQPSRHHKLRSSFHGMEPFSCKSFGLMLTGHSNVPLTTLINGVAKQLQRSLRRRAEDYIKRRVAPRVYELHDSCERPSVQEHRVESGD